MMKAIGLMSGTSLDGLDIAYCSIEGNYTDTKVKLLQYGESRMPMVLKEEIQKACDIHQSDVAAICSLNFKLGQWFGDSTLSFMQENHICSRDVDYIASHGQTVYHIPEKTEEYERSTLQIGEPAEIALRTGCMVISNFRTMDMAAGGEGAPLVPYADYILYRSAEKTRVLLNIGGISNVTYLPRNAEEKDVFAFDTGPGNMMIDEAMRHFYHKEYDEDGNTAERGNVNSSLLKELMDMSYVRMNPPKSTGRELYGKQKVEELLQKYAEVSAEDAVCTFTEYTAASIAENVKLFLCPKGIPAEIIAAGGGAHNRVLLERLQEDLPEARVMKQEDMGFSSDAKEAIAFVILGNETLHRHYSNMISATGASKRVILGNITPKPMLK